MPRNREEEDYLVGGITLYIDQNGDKPLYINPLVINYDWAILLATGFGNTGFGLDFFGF